MITIASDMTRLAWYIVLFETSNYIYYT